MMAEEYFCPYCRLWIDDTVHRQHHHNDPDEVDKTRDWRIRIDGVVYVVLPIEALEDEGEPDAKQESTKVEGGKHGD
jgi:hypothetical protein